MTKFITNSDDLVTSHKATVEGFLKQALVKTEKATPYSETATLFYYALQQIQDIGDLDYLLDNLDYREGLIAAAGFSNKAADYASKEELDSAILGVFSTLKEKGGEAFREELVYRYLLTMGDTLGGSMRNYVGSSAKRILSSAIHDVLTDEMQPKINEEGNIQGFAWDNRLLLFDIKPAFIGKNVDALLFDTSIIKDEFSLSQAYFDIFEARNEYLNLKAGQKADKKTLRASRSKVIAIEKAIKQYENQIKGNPSSYLAGGELKGGIDPAGADEHWKTARSALDRIEEKFENLQFKPKLFYVAAAIQQAQAVEIFNRLENGYLTYAANLTVFEQVEDLAIWLVNL